MTYEVKFANQHIFCSTQDEYIHTAIDIFVNSEEALCRECFENYLLLIKAMGAHSNTNEFYIDYLFIQMASRLNISLDLPYEDTCSAVLAKLK